MDAQDIKVFNRYSGTIESERIYHERFLRWVYGSALGKLALELLLKRAVFSRWYGWKMDQPGSKKLILPFIETYGVNSAEFAVPPEAFQSFNDFFCRKLKPEARPICGEADAAVFPADGRHLGFQDISVMDGIFVKGQMFDLAALLQSEDLARRYRQGTMILSRLSPLDYHRYHFPAAGIPSEARLINGPLYSVNPIALRKNIRIFSENKRYVSQLETAEFGLISTVEVGATAVGRIEYTYVPDQPVAKGGEKGFFRFGGSSVLTFFEPKRLLLADDLVANTRAGREIFARMGDSMGIRHR
jgi:phosphatidylserine decarboxylase